MPTTISLLLLLLLASTLLFASAAPTSPPPQSHQSPPPPQLQQSPPPPNRSQSPPPPRRRLRSPPPPPSPPRQPPPPPPALGCATQVLGFSVCLPYISDPPNNITNSPTTLCCTAFESTFRAGEANCLCYLARQALMFGFPINATKLYSLSSFCPMSDNDTEGLGTLQSICSVSAALPPLRSTPGSGFSSPHNIDIGSSLPPITLPLPKPAGDLPPPESADQAPSQSMAPVISDKMLSASEQHSKNHIWITSQTLILTGSIIYFL